MSQAEDILFARVEEEDTSAAEAVSTTQKYLIFMIEDLKFGVDAETVVEIIQDHSITYLPMVPDYVRGIINLRGEMLPILDMRLRLGREKNDDSLVIVLNIDSTHLGILVDSVDQMIDIPKEDILPMPTANEQQLVSGMCSLPDGSGTMMVLECQQLLPNE